MRLPRSLLWGAPVGVVLAVSYLPFGPLPAVAPLFDPVTGIWSAAHQAVPPAADRVTIPALSGPVEGAIDQRGVPHLFAATDLDAWRALGWLHARDRLFEMELLSHATEGTLTEWVGAPGLRLDREMRELGLGHLADSLYDALPDSSSVRRALVAYADGVNARIASLGARDLPFEYHLLGLRPRPWRPAYTYYLAERMNYTLGWQDTDLRREAMATLVGDPAAAALLPANVPIQQPIVPAPGDLSRLLPFELPAPRVGRRKGRVRTGVIAQGPPGDLAVGSNSWVLAPSRTADGHPLLAGDPHLDLSLPSLWYEAHLVSRDGLDIYGATLPGAPMVLIGVTRGAAWSFTNSEADFVDRYRERVDDVNHPTRHLVDGAWRPVSSRIEAYHDRRGRVIATDTLYRTERGPLDAYAGEWRSTRWTALEAADPIGPFLRLQRTQSVAAFLVAMTALQAPGQNGVVADTAGHIAEFSAGRFPRRPNNDGGVIFDGSSGRSDWTGDLAPLPQVVDPPLGFLFSANEQIIDPRVDWAYRGNGWAPPWRAMRIARLAGATRAATVDSVRRWQTDPISPRAEWWLPTLLGAAGSDSSLVAPRTLLAGWRDGYRPTSRGAPLFEATMREAASLTWDELAVDDVIVSWPSAAVFASLRDHPTDIWWDRRSTPEREGRDDILRLALHHAWDRLRERGGLGPDTTRWRWDRYRTANIEHIAFLPGLGSGPLSVTGGDGTLSPLVDRGSHGASWRMVVELGPHPVAWTTYPGGQSGDPASPRYDDRLGEWGRGALDSARIPRTPQDLGPADRAEAIRFVPGAAIGIGSRWWPGGLWWLLPVLGALTGVVAVRRGSTPWWSALAGAMVWGGALVATWEPGASWRLATRLGALFGGAPPWSVVAIVPLWAALLSGLSGRWVALFAERDR